MFIDQVQVNTFVTSRQSIIKFVEMIARFTGQIISSNMAYLSNTEKRFP